MESLEELARRAAKGDREAFGNIYQALLDKVFGYFFWNLPSQEEAEDLTEEVFLRCLVHIRDYDPRKGSFRAWIFRIARNLLVDHLRRASVRKGSVGAVWEETEVSQDDRLEDEEGRRMVREALEELPETQRQVVIMKYFAGMDNAEVARALGRSEGAVNALQHRALRRLGGILERRGWGE